MKSEQARTIADMPELFNAADDLIMPNLAAGRGEKTALIDHRGGLTYAELSDRINRIAGAFADLNIASGERVLLCLLDTRDFPTVFLGAIKAGVVPVPLNTLLTADDFAWILDNSEAKAVFVTGELAERWVDIAADRPAVKFITSEAETGSNLGQDIEALIDSAIPLSAPAPTRPYDIAFWLYTSGSTGRPKGAMHMHASIRLTANLYALGTVGYHEGDIIFSVAKQFFAYGLGNNLSFPYAAGATVVLFKDRVTPQVVSDLMRQHDITVLGGVPTFFAGWLQHESCPEREELPGLRFATSAGEALPGHLAEAFRDRFGADILDGLGSTEMLHIFISQRPDEVRFGCTGRAVDGYEVRVIGDDGALVEPGEIGELQVRGETSAREYWRNPEKTAATFRDGWTLTGDKYTADVDGWLTYSGRGDDMLKVGGIYVSPIEVEETLVGHPAVLEAAVVADTDADELVKPHAYVVLSDGYEASEAIADELKAYIKVKLAPYKYPRWITFLSHLPKTATGKIQRFRLRA